MKNRVLTLTSHHIVLARLIAFCRPILLGDYQVIECQRDGERYQKIMGKVAREQGVAIVDINKLFESEKDIGLLFNGPQDPIHPSVIGHEIIAQAIGRIIKINELIPRVSNKVK